MDPAGSATLSLNRAREQLGLEFSEFELALQLGEVATVGGGARQSRVPAPEVARVLEAEGGVPALLERMRLVNTTEGAELIGISRDRLLRLSRAGLVRPVRWYVNRYRAVVWLYLGSELRDFASRSPDLLDGRLPTALRERVEAGEDLRPRGWRSRRVAQLVRDAPDAWEEAAVWAALLGPEVTDSAVPDPHERARMREIRTVLPPGRPGALAGSELIGRITTADDPDEIALGLVALADALGRARAQDAAPYPGAPAAADPVLLPLPAPPATVEGRPEIAPDAVPAEVPTAAAGPPRAAGERATRSLLRLLRGRRPVPEG